MHAPDSLDDVEFDFVDYEGCFHGPHALWREFHVQRYAGCVGVECAVDHVELVEVVDAVADECFDPENLLTNSVQSDLVCVSGV